MTLLLSASKCLLTLGLFVIFLDFCNTQSINGRIRLINRYIDDLDITVSRLEAAKRTCDENVVTITDTVGTLENVCPSDTSGLSNTLTNISRDIDNIDTSGPQVDTMIVLDTSDDADLACMRVPQTLEECIRSFEGEPIVQTNAQVVCLQRLLWTMTPVDELEVSDTDRINQFVNQLDLERPNYPRRSRRKEYRAMTVNERERFHTALDRTYREGTLAVFGRVHQRAGPFAHQGPSFLSWHRAFISLFEQALREKDPSVSLPYWDSSIDNDMDNPTNSILWTDRYMGNGAGEVNIGPFAGWVGRNGRLTRQYGMRSRLISKDNITNILTRCRLEEISRPTAIREYNLEFVHDGVHSWIGADMGSLGTAAYDPIFYLHHCFIDYIWEQFRDQQLSRCNVDPTTDYPSVVDDPRKDINASMSGMGFFFVRDGLADWWTQGRNSWFAYEDTPTCPFCGDAQSLFCATDINRCIPESRIVSAMSDMFGSTTTQMAHSGESRPPLLRMQQPQLDTGMFCEQIVQRDIFADIFVLPQNRGEAFGGDATDSRTLTTACQDTENARFNKLRGTV